MKSHTENSSYDFDSTIALALVLHVWKHNDLRKVTNLFQRMEFESLSCSSSISDICTLVGIDIPSWIVGDIITSIDNGLFCFQLATTKEY